MLPLFHLFIVAAALNLIYELAHSMLYETCRQAPFPRYLFLMLKGALFDGVVITAVWSSAFFFFANAAAAAVAFVLISVAFAWLWEKIALRYHRWEYAAQMPKIFGVGLTPLIQLTITGLIVLYLLRHL